MVVYAAANAVGIYVPIIFILFAVFVIVVARSRRGRTPEGRAGQGEAVSAERDVTP
ncbi:MAG: hypothetical protein KY439_09495 [Actinobacteria bacterium]|nr:hypothetical protein [Actinomycetota bacterium]